MKSVTAARPRSIAGFRAQLVIAMMIVVGTLTALVLVLGERQQGAALARELRTEFGGELAALHQAQALRLAALSERCRTLARRPRIHAALDEGAALILMDERGKALGSETFAERIAFMRDEGKRHVIVAIGGPDGHDLYIAAGTSLYRVATTATDAA